MIRSLHPWSPAEADESPNLPSNEARPPQPRPRSLAEAGDMLNEMRLRIENLAHRRGHPDPGDFFGELAIEFIHIAISRGAHEVTENAIWYRAELRLKDYYRKCARGRAREFVSLTRPEELPEHHSSTASLVSSIDTLVRDALARVPPTTRDVLERKFIMEQTNPEISLATGRSTDAVRSQTYRGKRLLERLLGTHL